MANSCAGERSGKERQCATAVYFPPPSSICVWRLPFSPICSPTGESGNKYRHRRSAMNPKITHHHQSKPAYVYLRQSTPGQVRNHQQSTERQYALQEKAQELGWSEAAIGYYYDEQSRVIKDPDEEVRSAVDLVLGLFRETGSACAVVRRFRERGLRFPTRIREGAWNGKLVWRELNHRRVLSILTNPCY